MGRRNRGICWPQIDKIVYVKDIATDFENLCALAPWQEKILN
jgi:hypothetical protein